MLIELLILAIVLVITYYNWCRNYWRRKGVFQVDGEFLFGSTRKAFLNGGDTREFTDDIYRKYKEKKLVGFYNFLEPMLVITDIDFIRQIFVTDFASFPKAATYFNKKSDPLLYYNPFNNQGEEWKALRGMHAAALTQVRLKENTPLLKRNGLTLLQYLMDNKSKPIKVNEIAKFYTIDNVVSTVYGYEPTAFSDPENGFRKHANLGLLEPSSGFSMMAATFLPKFVNDHLKPRFTSRQTERFFVDMAKKIIDFRRESNTSRNDLVDLIIKADEKRKAEGKKGMDEAEFAAHFMTIYLDSVETSSVVISFLLLEIANRPELQDRLREEIRAVGKDPEDFDFEKINSVEYLNMVFSEILRLHPLLTFFTRLCTKDTKLGDVVIDKGTKILIPYNGIITDPDYYPDPEKFDPDRFSPANLSPDVKKRFFPFGEGPKQCLGMKYAQLQIKLAVIFILLKFKLTPEKKSDGIVQNSDKNKFFLMPNEDEKISFECL